MKIEEIVGKSVLEKIAAELPNLDYETFRHVRYAINTRNSYISGINFQLRAGFTLDDIETRINDKLANAFAEHNVNLVDAYTWKIEVLNQMKEAERNDNA